MASGNGGSYAWKDISVHDHATAHIGNNFVTNLHVTSSFARQVFQSCMTSASSFHPLAKEVASFRSILEITEETIEKSEVQRDHADRLSTIIKCCQECLQDIQLPVSKYNDLPTASQWTRERVNFGAEERTELYRRFGQNVELLNALNSCLTSSSQSSVLGMLQKLIDEIRAGKREGSVLSLLTVDSSSPSQKSDWRMLRRELQDVGITVELFNQHKHLILQTLQDAITSGALEEQNLEDMKYTGDIQKPNSQDNSPFRRFKRFLPGSVAKLHAAVENGDTLGLAKILRRIQFSRQQLTSALNFGCSDSSPGCVELLLDNGADMEMVGESDTALTTAIRYNKLENAALLLDRGADINAEGIWRETSLIWAITSGLTLAVQLLLDRGADIEGKDLNGRTSLFSTIHHHDLAIAILLIERGANIEAKDRDGNTALTVAVSNLRFRIATLLIERGADYTVTDRFGTTLLGILQ